MYLLFYLSTNNSVKTIVPERIKIHENRKILLDELQQMSSHSSLTEDKMQQVRSAAITQ
jgi:hypothetical protein